VSYPFADLLLAPGAHPDLADELDLFGRFVGEWAMEVRFFDPTGETIFEGPGLWTFAWILDGRAIQDVLVYDVPDRFPAPPGSRRIGTSLRSFQPADGTWRVTWIGATAGIYLSLRARPADHGISITGVDVDGSPLHWAFTNIAEDSFEWVGRTMSDRDEWWVEQRMTGRRQG
jgi:hypothetical protein